MQWWCSAQGVPWTWSWQAFPGVWIFILLLVLGYRRLWRIERGGDQAPTEGTGNRIAAFVTGIIFLWLALDWPIGVLGAGYLVSAHMVQFLLLALIAPPFLIYSIPPQAMERLEERVRARRVLSVLTHPLIALVIFNATIIITHIPIVTDTAMESQIGSLIIDLAWIIAAFVFWWPVVAPVPERRWMHPLLKVGYIAAQLILGKPVFVYLTFSEYPVYAVYELAPRVHGIGAAEDQQFAGLLMEVAGALILFVAAAVLFLQWGKREEKSSVRLDTKAPEVEAQV